MSRFASDPVIRAMELLKQFRLQVMAEGIPPASTHEAMTITYLLDELEAGDHMPGEEHFELHRRAWAETIRAGEALR